MLYRNYIDKVVLSTIPHYISLFFIFNNDMNDNKYYIVYIVTVIISSTLSLYWHILKEPKNIVFYADYLFAVIWTILEIILITIKGDFSDIIAVIFLNKLVFITNQLVNYLSKKDIIIYEKGHSIWHILSSLKCIYVSYLIGYKY